MSTPSTPEPSGWLASGRHPLSVGPLVMGLAFTGLLLLSVAVQTDVLDLSDASWLLGVPWMIGGAAGLVASVVASRRRARADQERRAAQTPPPYAG